MPIIRHGYANQRAARQAQYRSSEHRTLRTRLRTYVDAGLATCARCGKPITPGTPWDLDHSDDRSHYLGPSHATCNRARTAPRGEGEPRG